MIHTVQCRTLFDITATGILGQYKDNRQSPTLSDGVEIHDRQSWTKARNQQRNWETINQIISLRVLPENITLPQRQQDTWCFRFDVEALAALSREPADLAYLFSDAQGVPMIVGLDESSRSDVLVCTMGTNINTWFFLDVDK